MSKYSFLACQTWQQWIFQNLISNAKTYQLSEWPELISSWITCENTFFLWKLFQWLWSLSAWESRRDNVIAYQVTYNDSHTARTYHRSTPSLKSCWSDSGGKNKKQKKKHFWLYRHWNCLILVWEKTFWYLPDILF